MAFKTIDMDKWGRKEYFNHYFSEVPCSYSITVKIDITNIKILGQKLYPTMLYYLSYIVNRHEEFRMKLDEQGRVGVFDKLNPGYTVFHKDSETFSNIWTDYTEDYEAFCRNYEQDMAKYGTIKQFEAKPDSPENIFTASMIPWESFEGFNLNLLFGNSYLLPIFTMGKYYKVGERFMLPLAIQVHHAVCDGFHVCRFVDELRSCIN